MVAEGERIVVQLMSVIIHLVALVSDVINLRHCWRFFVNATWTLGISSKKFSFREILNFKFCFLVVKICVAEVHWVGIRHMGLYY